MSINDLLDASVGNITNANLANLSSAAATLGAGTPVSGNLGILSNTCLPFMNYTADDYRLQQNGCSANDWCDLRYGGRNTTLSNCGTGAASCGNVTDDLNAITRSAMKGGFGAPSNFAAYGSHSPNGAGSSSTMLKIPCSLEARALTVAAAASRTLLILQSIPRAA